MLPRLNEFTQFLLDVVFGIFKLLPLLSISVTTQPANAALQKRRGEHLDPLTFDCSVQAILKKIMKRRLKIFEERRL